MRLRRPPAAAAARRIGGLGRWATAGALLGACAAVLAFAPAAWLAGAVAGASQQRLLLADARGSVWSGSAVAVLTGGADSRSASALPGRLAWTLGWHDGALEMRLRQACCLRGEPRLRLRPAIGHLTLEVAASDAADAGLIGHLPAALLAGLGAPWNTLEFDGEMRLASPGIAMDNVQGRWRVQGQAVLDLPDLASRLSTLPTLGSYRLQLAGKGDIAQLTLTTLAGPLQLSGNGEWVGDKLRFRGDAAATPGAERALDNLLNIIGRRQGARSLIAIG